MKLIKMNFKERKPFFIQMGTIVAILVAFMAFNPVNAQDRENVAEEDTTVYTKEEIDVLPEYPGGDEARIKHLINNLEYPKYAREVGLEGRVEIGFIVEKDGSMSNFTAIKSVHPILDEESLRVIKLMPKWIPGKKDGKTVRVQWQIPITFTLSDGDERVIPQKGKKRKK